MQFAPTKSPWGVRKGIPTPAAVLLVCGMVLFGFRPAQAQKPGPPAPVVVDTDAGTDDLMAIAFLLSRSDVHIEAITLANGMAHVPAGGKNVLRLLTLAHRDNIPVYLGRETPLSGNAAFPAAWRETADNLAGVTLPQPARKAEDEAAAKFLARRISDRAHPVRILALGPLTNLGEALDAVRAGARTRMEIVIMGGAFNVKGNLGDGGAFQTDNISAEWNMFVDPAAAVKVLDAGGTPNTTLRFVPLDATTQVPIDLAFLKRLTDGARNDLAQSVAQILNADRSNIQQGIYSAWDPLAAVAMVNPRVAQARCVAVAIRTSAPESGRTVEVPGKAPNACVAFGADREGFYRTFLGALEPAAIRPLR